MKLTRLILICAMLASVDRVHAEEPVKASESKAPASSHWLQDAPSDDERFMRLARYLRGFDQPMWEVGERYQRVEQALRDQNWDLAAYHWEKIKSTIEGGLMKRPKRRANAEALFLGQPWQAFNDALKSGDAKQIGPAFGQAKGACMACHAAEKVGFMNDQPLFRAPLPLPLP